MTGAPGARLGAEGEHPEVARAGSSSSSSAPSASGAGSVPASSPAAACASAAVHRIAFRTMRSADLSEVEAVERHVYSHPWTLGNFQDSLASGYQCVVAHDAGSLLVGYFLLMLAPDEAHLLNITIVPAFQGKGFGRLLLDRAAAIARSVPAPAMLLEVRPSNTHALAVYRHVGFTRIGIRKAYYPAAGHTREDAIVMRLAL